MGRKPIKIKLKNIFISDEVIIRAPYTPEQMFKVKTTKRKSK